MPGLTARRRWALFATLCVAGVFNAMDRPVFAILKPDFLAAFGWGDREFGDLAAVTQFAAALAFLGTGWLVDRLGVDRGMRVGAGAWSLAAIAHGGAVAGWQVVGARIGLGATEAMQTPLTIKTVATLFPPDRRSLAFGVSTLLAGIGTILTPFAIPPLAAAVGWRGALAVSGVGGLVALALWIRLARGVPFEGSDASDAAPPAAVDRSFLRRRATWGIIVAKALSDMTWWFVNFWLADYYRRVFGLSTVELAVPLGIAFAGSGLGALLAGWVSTHLLERGWPLNRVRKGMLLASALVVAPLPLVLRLEAFWPVAAMMGLVMAGHQGFSLTLFSIITDMVPAGAVGRVTAAGAFAGNLGGVLISAVTGRVLAAGLGFTPLFVFATLSYPLALVWLQLLLPRVVRVAEGRATGEAAPAPPRR